MATISFDFSSPTNLQELALLIGVSPKTIIILITPQVSMGAYTPHYIPKRSRHMNGECRLVWEAHSLFADTYKAFLRRFDLYIRTVEPRYPHTAAYGYVRGRSTVDNARMHLGASLILHADITNFFPSILKSRLKNMFEKYGVQSPVAELLSSFVTIDGTLPLGLHASPTLANIVCLNLDDKLQKLAEEYGCTYTRYADDITISGTKSVPTKEAVQQIIESEDFQLSERKFRITKPGQSHYVTGLSVTDRKFPRAPRSMKRNLRQELFFCNKFGIENHLSYVGVDETVQHGINRIDGYVKYVSHIEKLAMPDLRQKWSDLLAKEGLEVSYEPLPELMPIKHVDMFIDETELEHGDKKYLALCIAQTENSEQIDVTAHGLLRQHTVDPFSGARIKTLDKRKLHFTDVTEDLRKDFVEKLSILPFRAYVAFAELPQPDQYENTYIRLLEAILPDRLIGCDQAIVRVVFEENSQVKKSKLITKVDSIQAHLVKVNNRQPKALTAIVGTKSEHLCFSVPDFMLAAFSGYARHNVSLDGRRRLFFESLRDKYRIILDADKCIVYSRKRPFAPW